VFSPQYFGFSLSGSFHKYSVLILLDFTLLLSEGQAGETWETSKKDNALSDIREVGEKGL
jgi:hypothetical protein